MLPWSMEVRPGLLARVRSTTAGTVIHWHSIFAAATPYDRTGVAIGGELAGWPNNNAARLLRSSSSLGRHWPAFRQQVTPLVAAAARQCPVETSLVNAGTVE